MGNGKCEVELVVEECIYSEGVERIEEQINFLISYFLISYFNPGFIPDRELRHVMKLACSELLIRTYLG